MKVSNPKNASCPPAAGEYQTSGVEPVRCIDCGYDLRAQRSDGHCPECGFPVLTSQAAPLRNLSAMLWRVRVASALMLLPAPLWLAYTRLRTLYPLPRVQSSRNDPIFLATLEPWSLSALPLVAVMVLLIPLGAVRGGRRPLARWLLLAGMAVLLLGFTWEPSHIARPVFWPRVVQPAALVVAVGVGLLCFARQSSQMKMRPLAWSAGTVGALAICYGVAAWRGWPRGSLQSTIADTVATGLAPLCLAATFILAVLGLAWSGRTALQLRAAKDEQP